MDQNKTNENAFCEISFAEKVRLISSDYLRCCSYLVNENVPTHTFTKKLYSELVSTSQVLEDFLDFHGAKNNENWYLYSNRAILA